MADITVQVTSPGTLTTWGYNSWDLNSWGQITGAIVEQNSANITIDVSANASTNLISLSLNSVSVDIAVLAELNTNLINSTVNSVFGGESIFVEVITPGSNTTWGYDSWNLNSWGQIVGLDINLGNEDVALGIQQDVTGQQLNLTSNDL